MRKVLCYLLSVFILFSLVNCSSEVAGNTLSASDLENIIGMSKSNAFELFDITEDNAKVEEVTPEVKKYTIDKSYSLFGTDLDLVFHMDGDKVLNALFIHTDEESEMGLETLSVVYKELIDAYGEATTYPQSTGLISDLLQSVEPAQASQPYHDSWIIGVVDEELKLYYMANLNFIIHDTNSIIQIEFSNKSTAYRE